MGKGKKVKKKSKKTVIPKATIQELSDARDGGQIALRGYSYQFLYSCYLILSETREDVCFRLEGIEDIDYIKYKENKDVITHIQLKYSINKQDASFLRDVLKNFLEVYLLDQNRLFKLVYDFPVAKGNLSKIFELNLDDKSRLYWSNVIADIKSEYPSWNWSAYDFDNFVSKIMFEKIEKHTLESKIERALIEYYDITTDNLSLFANSIKILCFEKMEQRADITPKELDVCIQSVKFDISKGPQNPAHSWIRKLNYEIPGTYEDTSFYEGKKATPADIASGLPVCRPVIEQEIIESIEKNKVTVIKASSGQGKTTLALQVAYVLQNDYTTYQLLWCDDMRELGNISQYFKTRIKLGEKLLIFIDNLDAHLEKWNNLMQLMQSEIVDHYKFLITSRQIDWYNYGGDLSKIQSINIIKPVLDEKEALEIFRMFKDSKRIHSDITSWQKAWNKIADRQLLIEYVYLLTHGKMLSERISAQMSEIGKTSSGNIKCEILRKVCFADICGIKMPVNKLVRSLPIYSGEDYNEILKSMEDEFLVHVSTEGSYIEGLHPVRSKHIIDRLHEFLPLDDTALAVIKIVNKKDLSVLFSHIPEFKFDKDEFFGNVVDSFWNKKDLSSYIYVIQGLFSGSVMQYYYENKSMFDDANIHGGLFFLSTEMCPFTQFTEFDVSVDTLDKLRENFPGNKNVAYWCKLRDNSQLCNLYDTYVYLLCRILYEKLRQFNFSEIDDVESYGIICEWLYHIDVTFNLSVNFSLDDIWVEPEKFSLNCISSLMYISFCGNRKEYMQIVESNFDAILIYLKHHTKSQRIFVESEQNAIHVEYILRLRDIKKGNEESVSRLKSICKTLPIYELYCADAMKPVCNLLSGYTIPDDSHKTMPIKNIVIMFRQNLTSLWNKTIMSNYECDTVAEWLDYWFDAREHICLLADKCCACMYKQLSGKSLGTLAGEVDKLREELDYKIIREVRYPKEDRPFEGKAALPDGLSNIKNEYFHSISDFFRQLAGFLRKDSESQNLAFLNIKTARSNLEKMQNCFLEIDVDSRLEKKHLELCLREEKSINSLFMSCGYYQTHSANNYFNKYQVKTWYEETCRNERNFIEESLGQSLSEYLIHFPITDYTIGMLSYYPVIVDDFDVSSSEALGEWIIGCLPFAASSFDYLVVLFTDGSGKVKQTALQIPKKMFKELKEGIEAGENTLFENIAPPYPVEATKQMLKCFCEKYELLEKDKLHQDVYHIGDIAEELWVYSKMRELLTAPVDADYLRTSLKEIESNILEMFGLLKNKLPNDYVEQLSGMCCDVYNGQNFDDVLFNEFIEKFAIRNLK